MQFVFPQEYHPLGEDRAISHTSEPKTLRLKGLLLRSSPNSTDGQVCKLFLREHVRRIVWTALGTEFSLRMNDIIGLTTTPDNHEVQPKVIEYLLHAFVKPKLECQCGPRSYRKSKREFHTFTFRFPISATQTKEEIRQFFNLFNKLLYSGEGRLRPRKLVVVVNPFGGHREAKSIYESAVKPMFQRAQIQIEYYETTSAEHAFQIAEQLSIEGVHGIVGVGGDGLINQLLNGFMKRKDYAKILRIPFGLVPAGSQNALAISVNGNISSEEHAFLILKGKTKGLDIIQAHNEDDGSITYGLICVAVGLIGDILHESENHRWMGPTRYQFSAVKHFFKGPQFKHYKAKIEYLLPPSLLLPSPSNSNLGTEEQPSSIPQWQTLEINEFQMLHAFNVAAETTQTSKQCYAECDDGMITLLVLRKGSRWDTIHFLMNTTSGNHLQMDSVKIIQAKQIRLTLCDVHCSPVNIDGELHKKPSVLHLRSLESAGTIFVRKTAEEEEEEELEDDQVREDELERALEGNLRDIDDTEKILY